MELNFNNIEVSKDGRVTFSGLRSNIDFVGAVDAIMKARRIPADRLDDQISGNEAKIAAYQELRTGLNTLKDALGKLYGAVSADNSKNIFEAKEVFAGTRREDGQAPSRAADLLGVSVTSSADVGNHTIEVVQTARSHRVGSATFAAGGHDLGTALGQEPNSIAGKIEIAGKSIDVLATDTVADLAARINNANKGNDATGVSASVVQVSATERVLVLTVDKTGKTLGSDVALADPDGVLEKIGVLSAGGGFANQLQAARSAKFYADGLLDNSKHASAPQASSTDPLGAAGTIELRAVDGTVLGSIDYASDDSMQALRDAINANQDLQAAGIAATVEASGGGFVLRVHGDQGFTMADSGTVLADLGMARERQLLERSSNTIDDLFKGVTLTLFNAEPGTTIELEVERDLSQVKNAIVGFVDAYNGIRELLNFHLDADPVTGKPNDGADLYGSRTLSDITRRLAQTLGSGTAGVDPAFRVLAQIGVDFVNNNTLNDPLRRETLTVNNEKLDAALLNSPDDVRKLFQFDFSSSDPRVSLLAFNGKTTHSPDGYQLDLAWDDEAGKLAGATLDDGEASVKGNEITVNGGGAAGLKLFYSGDSAASDIRFDFTVGLGAQLFFAIDDILDDTNGLVESEVRSLTERNARAQERIEQMELRLEMQRETMLQRFITMERALARMNSVMESVDAMTKAMFADK